MSKIDIDTVPRLHLRRELQLAGWRKCEIDCLLQFLNTHQPTFDDVTGLDRNHLEFVRYLVHTGKIKE